MNPRVVVPLEMLLERFRVLRMLSERLEHCMMDALSRFVIVVDEMVADVIKARSRQNLQ